MSQVQQQEQQAQQGVQQAQQRLQQAEHNTTTKTAQLAKLTQEYQIAQNKFDTARQQTEKAKRESLVAEMQAAKARKESQQAQAKIKEADLKLAVTEVTLQDAQSQELFLSGQTVQALLTALRAEHQLKQIDKSAPDKDYMQRLVMGSLQQAVYNVREYNTLSGHQGLVWSVSFSPDGQTIASASDDKTVKLWSREGKLLHTLTGRQGAVWSVSFSPDGQTLASASNDGTIKLWNWNFDSLMKLGCDWIHDYLITNPTVSESDRQMCGITIR